MPSASTRAPSAIRTPPSAVHRIVSWLTGDTARQQSAHQVAAGVLALDSTVQGLTDAQLAGKTAELRARLVQGASLDDLQVEAFAVAREAARRVTGLTANDKQVLGAAYAHAGGIVEMKTGEGKTLMEVMPAYLHALTGGGVHIMTANDYLAGRDRETLAPVFEKLGLTTAVVNRQLAPAARKLANAADVTYGTAAEFGFQYLNDHLTQDPNARVTRDLSKVFALVDEADKVMLDEATTPLVISAPVGEDPAPVQTMAAVARQLVEGKDFEKDLKTRQAWLTESGLTRVEKMLGVGELYTAENQDLLPYLQSAVQARALFVEGRDYLRQGSEVVLIDEFTGRPKPGHRFSEGLHQAIEAQEGLRPGDGAINLASVNLPSFLKKYGKLSGMTGTGSPEFSAIYGLDVQAVPTHRPVARQALPDRMFADGATRDQALADHVAELHRSGRPVLLGTRSIERSEELSALLELRGIPHNVLNARNLTAEAAIVEKAGKLGAVTVATNMAGRGTDIKLGGGDANERAHVVALGGLAVLGSERHEARRIDEQLAGRAGRQGDPGTSQFFLSRDDELFKLHGDKAFTEPAAMVVDAQRRSEDRGLEGRTAMLKFEQEVNRQRDAVYGARDAALDGEDLTATLEDFIARLSREEMTPERRAYLGDDVATAVAAQKARMGEAFGGVLRAVYVRSLDSEWVEQMAELDRLREGNRWEGYQEEEPVRDYERKAHEAYDKMILSVAARTVHGLLSAKPLQS